MNKFDVSVIVPCYNCEKYVEKTIKSVLTQEYETNKIELILINDGSSDNTLNILKTYENENTVVIDKNHEGVNEARNLGIKKANGKYILFLDSDDYISNNTIKHLVSFFDEHFNEIDLVTYPIINIYKDGKELISKKYSEELFDKGTEVYDLNTYYHLVQSKINIMIKNNKEVLFDPSQFFLENEQFNTKILMQKKKLGFVKEAKYYYRKHNKTITARKNDFNISEIHKFYDDFIKEYNNHPYIQSIILNNLKWRIKENYLFQSNLQVEEKNSYIESVTKRLKNIDFKLFDKKHFKTDQDTLLHILALSNQKFKVKGNSLIQDDAIIIDNIESKNYIYRIENKDKMHIYGKLTTALFYKDDISLYIEKIDINDNVKTEEIDLYYNFDYEKNYLRKYTIEVEQNIRKIRFVIKSKEEDKELIAIPVEWCSKKRIYGKYKVTIDNIIKIEPKKLFDILKIKLVKTENKNFNTLNITSLFYKKHKVYFSDKNSELYNLYQFDRDRSKVFIDKITDDKYKLIILSAKKLITDKSINEVLPFGKMTNKYIEASTFDIEYKGSEQNEN